MCQIEGVRETFSIRYEFLLFDIAFNVAFSLTFIFLYLFLLQSIKGAPYYVGAAQTLPRGMYSDRNKNIIGKLDLILCS